MKRYSGLGQYVPVDSPVHRLDAASKMGLVVAFTVGLFLANTFTGMAVFALVCALGVAVAHVPARMALRGIRAVSVILVLTVLFRAFNWNAATTVLLRVGPVGVDPEGLRTGLFFAFRILLLVVGTSLLTLTTSPVELADGIERVLGPLKLVRVPVGDLAMTLTIALRFIPTTVEEADRIVTAQTARGARFDSGGPVARARAYAPVLVPVFLNLFRRADELATAMEARCYRGTEGRTRLRESRMRPVDWVVFAIVGSMLVLAGVIL